MEFGFNDNVFIFNDHLGGNDLLRTDLDYLLNETSTVFDVGGYYGSWSEEIFKKYNCYIYIFEPVLEFYEIIVKKFENNKDKIKVFNFGFSNIDKTLSIQKNEDASTCEYAGNEKIQLKSISKFLKECDNGNFENKKIDLIKINVEGSEYEIFDDLIINNLLDKFICYQIQFHNFKKDHEVLRCFIQKEFLLNGFINLYNFDFVWESWILKTIDNKQNSDNKVKEKIIKKLIESLKKVCEENKYLKKEVLEVNRSFYDLKVSKDLEIASLKDNYSKEVHELNKTFSDIKQDYENKIHELNLKILLNK